MMMKCHICGKPVVETSYTRQQYKRAGRVYCSKECSTKYRSLVSSRVMAETNRKYASERMKRNNPMKNAESRNKMIQTLKKNGHKPLKRGGNGQYTSQQIKIAEALGWEMEVAVPTAESSLLGDYPNSYKIDVADSCSRIGIEVDGHSHLKKKQKKEDRKKTDVLESLGWTIIRFWNSEIDSNLSRCVARVHEVENAAT